MRKISSLIFSFSALSLAVPAQNMQILDMSNQANISGASIEIQSPDNQGWVGFETLDLSIKVIHTGGGSNTIGCKKIEHDTLQPDVQHTICFAGGCYPPLTFVSPNYVTLSGAGTADSSFIAHYLFDNTVHIRGLNHVSYVFYDVNNPIDSVVVHVTYNTVALVGIGPQAVNHVPVQSFPNPANEWVTFQYENVTGSENNLVLSNVLGEKVKSFNLPGNESRFSFNVATLAEGIYYYSIGNEGTLVNCGRIVVAH